MRGQPDPGSGNGVGGGCGRGGGVKHLRPLHLCVAAASTVPFIRPRCSVRGIERTMTRNRKYGHDDGGKERGGGKLQVQGTVGSRRKTRRIRRTHARDACQQLRDACRFSLRLRFTCV